VALGFDGEIVEVDPAEYNARVSWCRHQPNMAKNPSVEAHTLTNGIARNSGLEHELANYFSMLHATLETVSCLFSCTYSTAWRLKVTSRGKLTTNHREAVSVWSRSIRGSLIQMCASGLPFSFCGRPNLVEWYN
jgi:hypothetical protein